MKFNTTRLQWPGALLLALGGLLLACAAAPPMRLWGLSGICVLLLLLLLRQQRQLRHLQLQLAERLEAEARLTLQATHDSLTGLANRVLLADRFEAAVQRARRLQTQFALIMLDLNGFKDINDRHGHETGDQTLITVARRLRNAVRASDTVARLGGDEFVILVEDFVATEELAQLGRKLIAAVNQPMALSERDNLLVSASAGFAIYPFHGSELTELLRIADKGMYECKTSGLMELH